MLKKTFLLLIAAFSLTNTSCNTIAADAKPTAVATENSAKEARIKAIDVFVTSIDNLQNELEQFSLTKILESDLESEFPFWEQADFSARNNELVRCELYNNDGAQVRKEWFYYKNGALIFSRFYGTHLNDTQNRDTSTYYFEQGTLTMATREGLGVLDVSRSSIKLQAIDLKKEGDQLQNIFKTKFATRDNSK